MKRLSMFVMLLIAMASMGVCGETIDTTAAVIDAVEGNSITPVLTDILQLVIQIVTPALLILASAAAWKIAAKFGIEKNAAVDAMIRKYVKEGINWADAWAKKQSAKPTGDSKMHEAMRAITAAINASGLPAIAEDKLRKMIEAQLTYDEKEGLKTDPKTDPVINE